MERQPGRRLQPLRCSPQSARAGKSGHGGQRPGRPAQEGEKVFTDVFLADEIYTGPYLERAPDLVLGFSPGFGIFKDSTRGFVSSEIFHANSSTWSGDHCYHPDTIPGVLFCNRKLNPGAQITDLSATILDLQGVERPPWMEGKSLLPQGDALPTSIGGETVES